MEAELYLVSPEVAAATAIKGALAEPRDIMDDVTVLTSIAEPVSYPINDNLIIAPLLPEKAAEVEIRRGPNIKPLPVNTPPRGDITMGVSLKAGDNISTDDITPANAQFSSMRSNIPLIAEYAYSRYDPGFVGRARELGTSIIVAGENYGQGSSREHAAITPMFLGVKAVVAKSMARIHKNNLVNHGVIPMLFEDPADYDGIDLLDRIVIRGIESQIRQRRIVLENETKQTKISVILDLSDDETEMILAGGQLPHVKQMLARAIHI